MTKKTRNRNIIIVLALISVFLIAYGLTSGFQGFVAVQEEGKFIGVPTYGWLKCEESNNVVSIPPSDFNMFSSTSLNCKLGGDTLIQECDITFKMPSQSELGSKLSIKESGLIYSICTLGSSCNIGQGDVANSKIAIRELFFDRDYNFNKEIDIHLKPNQFVVAQYNECSPLGSCSTKNLGRYSLSYRPFFIYKYDIFSQSTGRAITETRDCAQENSIYERNLAITSVRGNGKLSQQLPLAQQITLRSRDAVIPFLTKIVAIVPQYDLFEDDTKYCNDKKIYRVEEVETSGGIYKIADTQTNAQIKDVDCCNSGDVPTGYYCENFVKKKIDDNIQCNSLKPCPIVGYQSAVGQKMVFQECIDNICKTDSIKVKCSLNTDCPGGYCDLDSDNPKNNECVTIKPIESCGNGVCESDLDETEQSCPKDCTVEEQISSLWLPFLIAGIGIILSISLILWRMRKK